MSQGVPAPPPLGIAVKLTYGMGSVAYGVSAAVLSAAVLQLYFNQVIGLPAQMVASMKGTPGWQWLCAIAPTLVYDGLVMGGEDQSLPVDLLGGIEVPVLAVTSTGTAVPWLSGTADAVAGALPHGRAARLEGGFHEVPAAVLAPALAAFYREA